MAAGDSQTKNAATSDDRNQGIEEHPNVLTGFAGTFEKKDTLSILRKFLNFVAEFFTGYQITIINSLLLALTYGGEELLEWKFFNCPSNTPYAKDYVLYYVLGIASVFLLIGLLVCPQTWRICPALLECTWTDTCFYLGQLSAVIWRICLVPAAWLFFVLMDGDYYACIKSISMNNTHKMSESLKLQWKIDSRIYGYWFIFIILVFVFICILTYRCCMKNSYWLHEYKCAYKEAEEEVILKHIDETSKRLASTLVAAFAHNKGFLNKEDCNKISKLKSPEIKDNVYYSPLHELVVQKGLGVANQEANTEH